MIQNQFYLYFGRSLFLWYLCFRASSIKECDINGIGLWCPGLFSCWKRYYNLVLCYSCGKAKSRAKQNARGKHFCLDSDLRNSGLENPSAITILSIFFAFLLPMKKKKKTLFLITNLSASSFLWLVLILFLHNSL